MTVAAFAALLAKAPAADESRAEQGGPTVAQVTSLLNSLQSFCQAAGAKAAEKDLKALADDGRHVSIAFQRGAKAEISISEVMRRRLTLTGSTLRPRSVEFKTMVADEIAKTVWPYVEGGRLKPVVDAVFPLDRAAEAHARMEAGDHVGKIVLEMGGLGSDREADPS